MASSPSLGTLRTSVYSPKALLVQGETFAHRAALKAMGGSWNKALKGWIFSRASRGAQVCVRVCVATVGTGRQARDCRWFYFMKSNHV